MQRSHYFAALVALAAAGCQKAATPPPAGGPTLETAGGSPAAPLDHPTLPPAQPPVTSARPQRLTVNQLRRSLPIAMGRDMAGREITWRLPNGTVGLDAMAASLGEPNFISTTDEDLEASPLYAKFADDAARSICDQALAADAVRDADRVVMRLVRKTDTVDSNGKGVRDNLRYLKLRLHGVRVAPTDDAAVAPLAKLFDDVVKAAAAGKEVTAAHVAEGWRAVCVVLVNAPEFHAY